MTIKKGDVVTIKDEYSDEGDDGFTWVAAEDEDKGRVLLEVDWGGGYKKTEVFWTFMLEAV